jgi:hydroxyacylglutathione hydrolase
MAMVMEQILTEGIAQLSYLIGDDETGLAAVIDPRTDVEVYVELARKHKVSITHVFETHIHADFVSGARELAARVSTADIYLSHEGDPEYGFEHKAIQDGQVFDLGAFTLTARHTPGHTPEHMSYAIAEKKRPETPWAIFSGDALFADSAGRPDLLGEGEAEQLAEQLFHTLTKFFLQLDDATIVYPGHGHGSPCGAEIGDRLVTTIGRERKFNGFLQFTDLEEFKEHALSTAPPEPTYYKRMKKLNAKGPTVLGALPRVAGLPAKAFRAAIEAGDSVLLDTRTMLGFGGGHIPGAINIGALPELSIWAGWMLDPEKPLLLVVDRDQDVEDAVSLLLRTGYRKFTGYLVGGMKAWDNAGFDLVELPQMSVHELNAARDEVQVLDVRTPSEWKKGHIPGAEHIFLPELRNGSSGKTPKKLDSKLDKDKPVAVYCDSGYRASLASSLLQKEDFTDVRNVPGSWQAWKNAGFPKAEVEN